ncbi:MAG: hypothetical protein INH41_06275 [Myxococcaceae bacterium]|nr:hypothetical protein [Myxococcaceae bacterium]MCA3011994.1 hypothetical protein [Myxococcaceae bacterium]
MIHEATLALVVLLGAGGALADARADAGVAAGALADGGVAAAPVEDTTLERYRTPLEALTERPIGEASRAVRFDWRRSRVGFGVLGSSVIELNSFASARVGAYVRKALGNFMLEGAVTYVHTWGSFSTYQLSLTPFRQFARPSRLEVDVNLSYALAEGVVTPRVSFIPPAELVFSATAGLRYLYYFGALAGVPATEVLAALFAPRVTDREADNLEPQRLPGMQVARTRYSVLAGFQLDLYLRPGLAVTPRVLVSLPVFGGLPGAGLSWWWELSLGVGAAL